MWPALFVAGSLRPCIGIQMIENNASIQKEVNSQLIIALTSHRLSGNTANDTD